MLDCQFELRNRSNYALYTVRTTAVISSGPEFHPLLQSFRGGFIFAWGVELHLLFSFFSCPFSFVCGKTNETAMGLCEKHMKTRR